MGRSLGPSYGVTPWPGRGAPWRSWWRCHCCRKPQCQGLPAALVQRAAPGSLQGTPGSCVGCRGEGGFFPPTLCTPPAPALQRHQGPGLGSQEPATLPPPWALQLWALPLRPWAPGQASSAWQPRWFTTASLPRTARCLCLFWARAEAPAGTAPLRPMETPTPAPGRAELAGSGSGEITDWKQLPLSLPLPPDPRPQLTTWTRCEFLREP